MIYRLIILLLLSSVIVKTQAQGVKLERETFIAESEVPDRIHQLLELPIKEAKKVRYISEHDGKHDSYEVKFKLKERKFSVEFSKDAQLEDVEVDIKSHEIPTEPLLRIDSLLNSFTKHRVHKVQKQFSSSILDEKTVIALSVDNKDECTIKFEMEVSVKCDGHWDDVEMLFGNDGILLSQRRIIKRESDFILFR